METQKNINSITVSRNGKKTEAYYNDDTGDQIAKEDFSKILKEFALPMNLKRTDMAMVIDLDQIQSINIEGGKTLITFYGNKSSFLSDDWKGTSKLLNKFRKLNHIKTRINHFSNIITDDETDDAFDEIAASLYRYQQRYKSIKYKASKEIK